LSYRDVVSMKDAVTIPPSAYPWTWSTFGDGQILVMQSSCSKLAAVAQASARAGDPALYRCNWIKPTVESMRAIYEWDDAGAIAVRGRMVDPVEVVENATGPELSKPISPW